MALSHSMRSPSFSKIRPGTGVGGTILFFAVGVHADFHGSVSHMGDLADQHNNIIQISAGFKIQVIDGYGGGVSAAVTSGGGTGYFVDPL